MKHLLTLLISIFFLVHVSTGQTCPDSIRQIKTKGPNYILKPFPQNSVKPAQEYKLQKGGNSQTLTKKLKGNNPTTLKLDTNKNIDNWQLIEVISRNGKKSALCNNIALPVELVFFKAQVKNKQKIKLKWKTASETNNSHFLIQKRRLNSNWQVVDKVFGSGTTIQPKTYQYIDNQISHTRNVYYRLKQVDYDGSQELSKVIVVNKSIKKSKQKQSIIRIRINSSQLQLIYNRKTGEKVLKRLPVK
jgi:hypothetical protein